jgi:oligoendopeptidase F
MGKSIEPPEWDLSPLVESEDPEIVKKALDDSLKLFEKIEKNYKGRIKDLTPVAIFEFYRELDTANVALDQVVSYAYLRQCEDATNITATELFDYAMKVDSKGKSKLAFYQLEIAKALMDRPEIITDPSVKEYKHALEKAQALGKYLLSERDEQLIIDKDLYGVDSWSVLHEKLRGTRQCETRRTAAEALYKGISNDRLAYSTALKCVFGDHFNQVRLRKQPSVLTQSLLDNDIDQTAHDALIASMKKNTHLIRRYFKLRAKAMGLSKLAGYDIAAPIVESQSNIPWSKAKKMVIDSYTEFDKEAGEWVASLFEQKRIDASIRPGKTGFGFCVSLSLPRTSWVMINYNGALRGITTLAHEVGHALHGYYASEKHKWANFSSGCCLAETASIFGEMLLVDKLMRESDDDDTKLAALDKLLDSVRLMVFDMLNRYLFELSVFTAMENNKAIKDTVEWLPGMEQRWAVPVHHFMPRFRFYNYSYSFAQLLVFVLYGLYKEQGASFIPKMKRILSAGGSQSPKAILAEVGLDLNDPKFWEIGFEQAQSYLDEFERIVNR